MSLEAVSNGAPHTNSVCEKGGHHQTEENQVYGGGTSRRISSVRKTISGWLRLDRSTSTQHSHSHKIAQRSKSIENVRLVSGRPLQEQTDIPDVRGRNEERRVLSWGNWRRRMTSRSILPNHNLPPTDTQRQTTSNQSPPYGNSSVAKRALPPVPSPVPSNPLVAEFVRGGNVTESPEPLDEDAAGLHGIAAYIEDRPDLEEDEGAFSAQPGKGGLIDFAASIEKVKSVRIKYYQKMYLRKYFLSHARYMKNYVML